MKSPRLWLLLFVLAVPIPGQAETLILIQGYLGDAQTWRSNGITKALHEGGWRDGGHLYRTHQGVAGQRPGKSPRRMYTIELPTEAPLAVQAGWIGDYVRAAQAWHPGESLILIGHSAGGVAARLFMVEHADTAVSALVTIASPHLGTDIAALGESVANSPIGWFAGMLGEKRLQRGAALFRDLSPEQPGNLLFWLNRQPHPNARYVSIVRAQGGLFGANDKIVPPYAQDMNNVAALRGRAQSIASKGDHLLDVQEGRELVRLLNSLLAA
ncbi:MAG: hypothetical protein KDG50_05975 [Chromatiales bacterium]|nr:hypothetical protein [Chromatiales bacterium]